MLLDFNNEFPSITMLAFLKSQKSSNRALSFYINGNCLGTKCREIVVINMLILVTFAELSKL